MEEELDIGGRLRNLRQTHGLSLERLAQHTSISSSFLSLVEQGKSDISFSRLMRLARFYGLTLGDLFSEDDTSGLNPLVVRRNDRVVHSPAEGIDVLFLLVGQEHPFTASVTRFEPERELSVEGGLDQESLAYVLTGTFRFAQEGSAPVTIQMGDTVVFQLRRAHVWTNLSGQVGELLNVHAHPWANAPTYRVPRLASDGDA
jgi:transcriptional regulator with XRE-family HTH domain